MEDSEKDPDPLGRELLASYATDTLDDRGDSEIVYGLRVLHREMILPLVGSTT